DAHGCDALFDEAAAEGRNRDGAARARIQSHACHEYLRCPTTAGGDEGIIALLLVFTTGSDPIRPNRRLSKLFQRVFAQPRTVAAPHSCRSAHGAGPVL